VRAGLTLDPYFVKLADAMVVWVQCWQQFNGGPGPKPDGRS
jgi:hypothetical protein